MNEREKRGEVLDIIAYIMAYAPDRFPYRDFLAPDAQMNLDRAFSELRERFLEFADLHGESSELDECRTLIDESYQSYRDGDSKNGILTIQKLYHALGYGVKLARKK